MDKEKLIIRNFGPIKDMTFDFKKVNIFIGDQGTGKSSVAKLYSLIKNLISIPFLNVENFVLEKDISWQFEQYVKNFDIEGYFNDDTNFEYFNSDLSIEIKYTDKKINKIDLKYSPNNIPQFNYIVAERIFVSILSDALYGIINSGARLPVLFNRFGNKYTIAKKKKEVRFYSKIIGVDFSHMNGVDFIINKKGKLIPLSAGSSGIQGTIPMLVVFDSVVENIVTKSRLGINENNLMVIEEPESNLFPESQKEIINYFIANNFYIPLVMDESRNNNIDDFEVEEIENYDEKKYKNQLIITTQSPYILTSLNNLINAFNIGQEHNEEINKIIEKKYWLNPAEVSAYMMLPDGTCEDIFDREENLIEADKIDSVSTELNMEFDAMLTVQFAEK